MNRSTFNLEFGKLLASYHYAQEKHTQQSQEMYWEMLKDLPDEKFTKAVHSCVANCKFFPSIAELGDAALPKKTGLSSYKVQTKNGADRLPVVIGWQEQLEELKLKQVAELPDVWRLENIKKLGEIVAAVGKCFWCDRPAQKRIKDKPACDKCHAGLLKVGEKVL